MFSLFKKSDEVVVPNKVWKTKAAALKGMMTEGMKEVTSGSPAIVITFFSGSYDLCLSFLKTHEIPFATSDELEKGKNQIILLQSHDIELKSSLRDFLKTYEGLVLFYGRYPISKVEQAVLSCLPKRGARNLRVFYCVSLEDAFFKNFGADRVKTMMETLGMKEDECIEHRMVDKAIANAQEKLSKSTGTEVKAHSEEEWFTINKR